MIWNDLYHRSVSFHSQEWKNSSACVMQNNEWKKVKILLRIKLLWTMRVEMNEKVNVAAVESMKKRGKDQ
jgi:hypothetical protein